MDSASLDSFEGLILLARKLKAGNDPADSFQKLLPEETCFALYDIDEVEEAFLAAANRLADRLGLVLFRLDVEDGRPSFLAGFGISVEDARKRLAVFVEHNYGDESNLNLPPF